MAVSKREKTLIVLTAIVVVCTLVYSFGAQDMINEFTADKSNLAEKRAEYEEKAEFIMGSQDLIQEYKDVGGMFVRKKSQYDRPESVFSEDVANICRKMQFFTPNIEPARRDPIEGVNDYEFLTINVNLKGKHQAIANVLKEFHQSNFIIRNLSIRNRTYDDEIIVTVEVARLVQTKEAARREQQRQSRSNRRRLIF